MKKRLLRHLVGPRSSRSSVSLHLTLLEFVEAKRLDLAEALLSKHPVLLEDDLYVPMDDMSVAPPPLYVAKARRGGDVAEEGDAKLIHLFKDKLDNVGFSVT